MATKEEKGCKRKRSGDSDEEECKRQRSGESESQCEKILLSLSEEMRQEEEDISENDRSILVTRALQIMTMEGKLPEIAGSHDFRSRLLQKCIEFCTQTERADVFKELKPHFLSLACNVFAIRLVTRIVYYASVTQLEDFISSVRGHVVSLLKQKIGSGVIIEHAFQLANTSQKQSLLVELYSTDQQLCKDMILTKKDRLVDIIQNLGLHRDSVQQEMASVIDSILNMGVADHSIIHSALLEYFSIADEISANDMMEKLAPYLTRMIHTRAGSELGILCVKYGSAKVRRGFIRSIKNYVKKMAYHEYGSTVLACILFMVGSPELINKHIIPELRAQLKKLSLDERGRLLLLQFLCSDYQRYLGPEELDSLSVSIPSLSQKEEDPSRERRIEILVNSGLAESLIDMCIDNAGELLRSNFGKEVIYEVAIGGTDQVLQPTFSDKLQTLHQAIATLAAVPKEEQPEEEHVPKEEQSEEEHVPKEEQPEEEHVPEEEQSEEEEHVLLNYHSCKTIRKLILNCPSFAATLWKTAFQGKCETWFQGHNSFKVVCAFWESPSSVVKGLVYSELQGFINPGTVLYSSSSEDE
ncbi:hypothetical protein MKW92_017467 [Papaver armeniacum]|nr:hypothetical protein MKW92_017467 [Papaver armeniacum]